MPGGGDFCFVFLTRGPEFCTEKAVPGVGISTGKISGPAVSRGDGNWSNDTCITAALKEVNCGFPCNLSALLFNLSVHKFCPSRSIQKSSFLVTDIFLKSVNVFQTV